MEEGGGRGRWKRAVEEGGGRGRWKRAVEEGGGRGRWKRAVEVEDAEFVQGLNKISPFLPFVCVDAVLDVIIQSLLFRRGGHLVLSSHPISLLVQVPRGVCVVQ